MVTSLRVFITTPSFSDIISFHDMAPIHKRLSKDSLFVLEDADEQEQQEVNALDVSFPPGGHCSNAHLVRGPLQHSAPTLHLVPAKRLSFVICTCIYLQRVY